MKLLIDMNLSPRWADVLNDAGFEAIHWAKVGAQRTPDSQVMAYAAKRGWVLVAYDLDTSAILAAPLGERPSVVQVAARDIAPEVAGAAVVAALRQAGAALEKGALVAVDPAKMRLHLLPFSN